MPKQTTPVAHRIKLPSIGAESIGAKINEILGRGNLNHSNKRSYSTSNLDHTRPTKHLRSDAKAAIIVRLQELLSSGNSSHSDHARQHFENSVFAEVGSQFNRSVATIKQYWMDYQNQLLAGICVPNLEVKSHTGRPSELSTTKRQAIESCSRKRKYQTTARIISRDSSLDSNVRIPITSAWRYRKQMGYTKHNVYAKTGLTISHMIKRLEWAIGEVEIIRDQLLDGEVRYQFYDLKNRAFFDEKWFMLSTKKNPIGNSTNFNIIAFYFRKLCY